jgi:endonuclease/exonuclease/phosphatase family metal-dependent hydrolase
VAAEHRRPDVYRLIAIGFCLLLAIFALVGCTFVANRFHVPAPIEGAEVAGSPNEAAGKTLSVTTWNIGYAGMGAESDFVMDKGTQRRPLGEGLVDRNLAAIATWLAKLRSDVILLQEVAEPSWSTYRRDVHATIRAALPDRAEIFGADIDTRFVPAPFNVRIGNASYSRKAVVAAERRGLPLEPTFEFGMFRKGYRIHVLRLSGSERWVVANIHLSTFDSSEANVRALQVAEIMRFAMKEYAAGNHVIVGGDWNLRLADSNFPDKTAPEFKFWVRDLPDELIPEGWKIVADARRPTVRGAHQPYVAGDNFTLVIDGFLISPNVAAVSVETVDLGFSHSDHNPVNAVFQAR